MDSENLKRLLNAKSIAERYDVSESTARRLIDEFLKRDEKDPKSRRAVRVPVETFDPWVIERLTGKPKPKLRPRRPSELRRLEKKAALRAAKQRKKQTGAEAPTESK